MIYFNQCPNCKSTNTKIYIKNASDKMHGLVGYWDYYICKKCRIVFQNNLEKEKITSYYPLNEYYTSVEDPECLKGIKYNTVLCFYSDKNVNWYKKVFYIIFKSIIQGIPKFVKNGKVLDIGCGNGKTLNILKSVGWDTYGFELNPKSIQIIQRNGHGVVDNIEKCNVKFDAILMQHVIEHIYDFNKTVSLLKTLLRENGELIITTPNRKSLNFYLFTKNWFHLDCPRHVQIFYPNLLKNILCENGFTVERIFYTGQLSGIEKSFQYRGINLKFTFLLYPICFLLNLLKIGDEFQITARKNK